MLLREITKRGGTAPRVERAEKLEIPLRVPKSSAKSKKISIPIEKYSAWDFYKPKESMRTVSVYKSELSQYPRKRPEEVKKHLEINNNGRNWLENTNTKDAWEEGKNRPKTQNKKCRTKISIAKIENNPEAYTYKEVDYKQTCEIPFTIVKNHKSAVSKRPDTYRPNRIPLSTSLDQEFLDLFQS